MIGTSIHLAIGIIYSLLMVEQTGSIPYIRAAMDDNPEIPEWWIFAWAYSVCTFFWPVVMMLSLFVAEDD